MKEKPNNLSLSGEFYLNNKDYANMRTKFVQAWHTIRRLDWNQLGKKLNFGHASYTQWVIDRAMSFGLPYTLPRSFPSTIPHASLPLPPCTQDEYQERLAESNHESATWKRKYNEAMLEMETMSGQLEQNDHQLLKQRRQMIEIDELLMVKDRLLDRYANKKKRMDFFSGAHSDSDDPPA